MKILYYPLFIVFIGFLTSCSENIYDKAIIDYIHKVEGQQAKIEVKIHSIKELEDKIVSDTVTLAGQTTEHSNAANIKIEELESQLVDLQDELFKLEVTDENEGRLVMESYISKITKLQEEIESLKADGAVNPEQMETEKTDAMPAVVVKCRYSVIYAASGKEVIETKNFVLSPDGKTCYGIANIRIEMN